ncbi:hypothetical protein B296_00058640 [Ensete ventricosum]|uniref:BHLH domain-containing protein n=1 Tax=Ensete ventricosum TaxID=4639 RepID=A0A426X6D2_ENSVE|nr:hypothetical protein B296_00058640 [Ensete ventricosum]
MRRDKLNDRFTDLCSVTDPGKPPKTDKFAILSDATRLLNQLRLEAKKFKQSNEALQEAIKNLKAEKLELRDEKLRLKAEKEQIEQMLKATRTAPQFITQPTAQNHPISKLPACGHVAMDTSGSFGYFSGSCTKATCCLVIFLVILASKLLVI